MYDPDTDTWVDLPTPNKGHGMVSLNGKLTLVGGLRVAASKLLRSQMYITQIHVLDSESQQWTEPYPPMAVGQRQMGCASYLHYLIIAGGDTSDKANATTSVDILDTKSGQ